MRKQRQGVCRERERERKRKVGGCIKKRRKKGEKKCKRKFFGEALFAK
jgi:hypothetical protein